MGGTAIGVEVRRPVVTFDDGHRATRSEKPAQDRQCDGGLREMLQHETDEDVVEGLGVEGQGEDVGLPELHIGESRRIRPPLGFRERFRSDVDRRESGSRAPSSECDRLGANATPRFEDHAAGRVRGVGVQELHKRSSLVMQAFALPYLVAMHVHLAAQDRTLLRWGCREFANRLRQTLQLTTALAIACRFGVVRGDASLTASTAEAAAPREWSAMCAVAAARPQARAAARAAPSDASRAAACARDGGRPRLPHRGLPRDHARAASIASRGRSIVGMRASEQGQDVLCAVRCPTRQQTMSRQVERAPTMDGHETSISRHGAPVLAVP